MYESNQDQKNHPAEPNSNSDPQHCVLKKIIIAIKWQLLEWPVIQQKLTDAVLTKLSEKLKN